MEVGKASLMELLLTRQWLIPMSNSRLDHAKSAASKLAEIDKELIDRVLCKEKKEVFSFNDEDFEDTLKKIQKGSLEESEEPQNVGK